MYSCRGDAFRFLWQLLKSKHKTVPVFDKVKYQTPELRSDSTEDVGMHNFVCCKFSPRMKDTISGFKLRMDFNYLVICQEVVVTNTWLHCANYRIQCLSPDWVNRIIILLFS